jgi:hypothetical protein
MNAYDKLSKIIESPRLRSSSKEFVASLHAQSQHNKLSDKQLEYVERFWNECFPPQEILDEEQAWRDSYTEEMRENCRIMGKYYMENYPASRMARGLKLENWIPDRELYKKSVETDWAQNCIANYKKDYKFAIGETVVFRDTVRNRSEYRHLMGSPLLVLDQIKNPSYNFKSYYSVIEVHKMEDHRSFNVSEDALNFERKKKEV